VAALLPPPAATATGAAKGEFVGYVGELGGIGLSTNGRQSIAYLCNGTAQPVSLAQWFKGPVTSDGIDITNADGTHLVATVSAQAITGTVTLKGGFSSPFTARFDSDPGGGEGLLRSEQTFNGVRCLGGWILSEPFARAPAKSEALLTAATFPLLVGACPPTGCVRAIDDDDNRGGILNERTGALIVSPMPSNLVSVTVPGLGTFRITQCLQAQC